MTRKLWYGPVLIALLLAVLFIRQRVATTRLQGQLREASAAHAELMRDKEALRRQMSDLGRKLAQDQGVIRQLWEMVQPAGPAGGPSPDPAAGPAYDEAAVRKLLASSGGNLQEALHAILTPDRLRAIQEKHRDEPAYWAAVASLLSEPEQVQAHLEEAAARHPESAMIRALLIDHQIARGQLGESTLASIQTLREQDPNNALADHYEASLRFKQGDVQGAVQALAAASEKDRFADHRLDLLMGRYHCLLESGCSDGMALGLSALTLPFSHLGMFREVGQDAVGQAQASLAAGDPEQALQVAEYLLRVGRNISASGRFLVYDQVGIGLQEAALGAKRQVYESIGNPFQLQELDYQLGGIRERSAQIADMAKRFGAILATMSEADLTRYIDGAILNGEFSTLQTLTAPGVNPPTP